MLKNKFKLLFMSISLFIILPLTSCSLFFNKLIDDDEDISSNYKCIDYYYSQAELDATYKSMDKVLSYLKNEIEFNRNGYILNFNRVIVNMIKIRRYYTIEYVSFCMKGYTENKENYLKFYNSLMDIFKFRNNAFKLAYENEKYKEITFTKEEDGKTVLMSDEEILELIEDGSHTDKYYELQTKKSEIEAEYNSLSTSEKVDDGYKYMANIINLNTELVKEINGYDDYISYSFEKEYSREYNYNDTYQYANYVREYAFPYAIKLTKDFIELRDSSKLNNDTIYQTYNMLTKDDKESFKYLDKYIDYMGTYEENFNNVFDNLESGKNYFVGKNEKSYSGAFTTLLFDYENSDATISPIMYFGNDYYDISTFAHEFGHYYSYSNEKYSQSYDLAETQSQTNEALMWSYLYNISDLKDDSKLYLYDKLVDGLRSIILPCIVTTIELELYKYAMNNELSEDKIDEIIDDTLNTYFQGYEDVFDNLSIDLDNNKVKSYCKRVCVTSSLYYISYSVSFLSTFSFYNESLTDFDSAADKYLKITHCEGDIVSNMTEIGYDSPFDEATFKKVFVIEGEN